MPHFSGAKRPSSPISAGAVTIAGQLVKALVQFTGLIAFSRILTPHEIGLIAILTIFTILGETVRDFGLLQAAIQTQKLSHRQSSNLFWSNTLLGFAMTVGLCLAAPAIANLFREPALREIAPWVALTFIISGLQTQFQVQLARDLRFAALAVTDTTAQVIGLAAGLTAALAGAGYWSLVIQMLCIFGSLLLQRALITGWRPGLPRREPGMMALYKFGLHIGLAQLLNYGAYNTDSYIIGIRWGASSLGVYNRAFQMFMAPSSQFLSPLTNVALPLLSRRRHEYGDFYPLLWKAQVLLSVGLTFFFTLAASLSQPIVEIALGPAWSESAPLLSILSIGGAAQVLSFTAFWAFLASGNAKQLFRSGLITRPLLALSVAVGSGFGLNGVAWGLTAGLVASWFLSLAWLKRCDEMPVRRFLNSGIHVLLCGFVSGAVSWVAIHHLTGQLSSIVLLITGFSIVTGIYVPLIMSSSSIRRFLVDIFRRTAAWTKALLIRGEGR